MTSTSDLIAQLSQEAKPKQPPRAAGYWVVRLLIVLAVYGAGAQVVLGIRPDLAVQFARPLFAAEIALLAALCFSSALACVLAMYPDAYQKPTLLKLPYTVFSVLVALMVAQLFLPLDALMMMPTLTAHEMECAICIASVSLIPSAIIFALLRKGASMRQFQAGAFAVLAASAIGCLTLRLAEENDSIMHLVQWHYLPTLCFAALGALAGKWLLKW